MLPEEWKSIRFVRILTNHSAKRKRLSFLVLSSRGHWWNFMSFPLKRISNRYILLPLLRTFVFSSTLPFECYMAFLWNGWLFERVLKSRNRRWSCDLVNVKGNRENGCRDLRQRMRDREKGRLRETVRGREWEGVSVLRGTHEMKPGTTL